MVSVKKLDVCIAGVKVGTLAVTDNYLCAFEYSDECLMNGYSISPFSLPLEKKVFIPKSYTPFDGLLEYLQTACLTAGADFWLTDFL